MARFAALSVMYDFDTSDQIDFCHCALAILAASVLMRKRFLFEKTHSLKNEGFLITVN